MLGLAVEAALELGVAVELGEHPVERPLQREAVGADAREPTGPDVAELRVAMRELRGQEVAHQIVVRGEPGPADQLHEELDARRDHLLARRPGRLQGAADGRA